MIKIHADYMWIDQLNWICEGKIGSNVELTNDFSFRLLVFRSFSMYSLFNGYKCNFLWINFL